MDFLSDRDIPCFLRNKKFFSLPSELTELFLYIIDEPVCKPVSACPMLTLEEDSNLQEQKKIMDQKIKDLNVKHLKMQKTKNNNMLAKVITTIFLAFFAISGNKNDTGPFKTFQCLSSQRQIYMYGKKAKFL